MPTMFSCWASAICLHLAISLYPSYPHMSKCLWEVIIESSSIISSDGLYSEWKSSPEIDCKSLPSHIKPIVLGSSIVRKLFVCVHFIHGHDLVHHNKVKLGGSILSWPLSILPQVSMREAAYYMVQLWPCWLKSFGTTRDQERNYRNAYYSLYPFSFQK